MAPAVDQVADPATRSPSAPITGDDDGDFPGPAFSFVSGVDFDLAAGGRFHLVKG